MSSSVSCNCSILFHITLERSEFRSDFSICIFGRRLFSYHHREVFQIVPISVNKYALNIIAKIWCNLITNDSEINQCCFPFFRRFHSIRNTNQLQSRIGSIIYNSFTNHHLLHSVLKLQILAFILKNSVFQQILVTFKVLILTNSSLAFYFFLKEALKHEALTRRQWNICFR